VGEGVPDWPPLLIIFLLCWVVMAWVVAAVLYLATFPERVGWLDGMLRRLRRGTGNGERYVRMEIENDRRYIVDDIYTDTNTPPVKPTVQNREKLRQPALLVWVSPSKNRQIRLGFADHALSTPKSSSHANPGQTTAISLLPRHYLRTEASKRFRRMQARQKATTREGVTRKTSKAVNRKLRHAKAGFKANSSQMLVVLPEFLRVSML
jgi:hypothetical protein